MPFLLVCKLKGLYFYIQAESFGTTKSHFALVLSVFRMAYTCTSWFLQFHSLLEKNIILIYSMLYRNIKIWKQNVKCLCTYYTLIMCIDRYSQWAPLQHHIVTTLFTAYQCIKYQILKEADEMWKVMSFSSSFFATWRTIFKTQIAQKHNVWLLTSG